jgi:hypothetical protein
MAGVNRDRIFKADNASVLITAAAFVLLLACLPLALRLDDSIDRNRPMYDDLSRMALMQDANLLANGTVVPVELSGGESVMVGEQEFVASDGVSVVVRGVDDDTAYCITTSNQYGEQSQEHCS